MDRQTLGVILGVALLLLVWFTMIVPRLPEDWLPRQNPPGTEQAASVPGVAPSPAAQTAPEAPLASSTDSLGKSSPNPPAQEWPAEPAVAREEFEIATDLLRVRFDNLGGVVLGLSLKGYHPDLNSPEELVLTSAPCFVHTEKPVPMVARRERQDGQDTVIFEGGGVRKTFVFRKGSFAFDYEIAGNLKPNSELLDLHPLMVNEHATFSAMTGGVHCSPDQSYSQNSQVMPIAKFPASSPPLSFAPGKLSWAGFRSKYFLLLAEPREAPALVLEWSQAGGVPKGRLLAAGGPGPWRFRVYAGPAHKPDLLPLGPQYEPIFNYTGIDPIIHLLLFLLEFFHENLGLNMGLAILLLTIVVRGGLLPLNMKAQSSMVLMSQLTPEIKKLQEQFKNDRQRLAQEQMRLFKEHGHNPMAGCLPVFIQVPVFLALFSAIGEGFSLRQAPFFGWIHDLSAPDRLVLLPFDLPFLGNGNGTTNLNLLVLLYLATTYIQQSLMPKSTDPQQQQAQSMMKIMMFVFAVFLYNYSSGLMVYWVGSNTWSIAESWYIRNKVVPRLKAKLAARKT